MNAELAAEFRALETVLSYSESGQLAWPDAEQDLDAFRDCARAASRLGWLGNDGAPEPPPPVGELDRFLLGVGGWLGPDTADVAAFQLAVSIIAAEREYRAAEWAALGLFLSHVQDGWPDDPAERAVLFEAVDCLRWQLPPAPLAPNGTPASATRKDPKPMDHPTPNTWAEVKATYATWADLKRAGIAAGELAGRKPTKKED